MGRDRQRQTCRSRAFVCEREDKRGRERERQIDRQNKEERNPAIWIMEITKRGSLSLPAFKSPPPPFLPGAARETSSAEACPEFELAVTLLLTWEADGVATH